MIETNLQLYHESIPIVLVVGMVLGLPGAPGTLALCMTTVYFHYLAFSSSQDHYERLFVFLTGERINNAVILSLSSMLFAVAFSENLLLRHPSSDSGVITFVRFLALIITIYTSMRYYFAARSALRSEKQETRSTFKGNEHFL